MQACRWSAPQTSESVVVLARETQPRRVRKNRVAARNAIVCIKAAAERLERFPEIGRQMDDDPPGKLRDTEKDVGEHAAVPSSPHSRSCTPVGHFATPHAINLLVGKLLHSVDDPRSELRVSYTGKRGNANGPPCKLAPAPSMPSYLSRHTNCCSEGEYSTPPTPAAADPDAATRAAPARLRIHRGAWVRSHPS